MGRPQVGASVLPYGVLDKGRLTASLITLASRVGVDGITMRLLAAETGTAPSSVYYHVKDKGELLDLLIDSVISTIAIPQSGTWVERAEALFDNAWHALIAIPGMAVLLQQRPHTPAANTMNRLTLEILGQSGLDHAELEAAHVVLYTHLLGAVGLHHTLQGMDAVREARRSEATFDYGLRVILAGLQQVSYRLGPA